MIVRVAYITPMSRLKQWMEDAKETDQSLGAKVGVSRVQISRIRRGINGASRATAQRLEEVTGIAWSTFIEPSREPAEKSERLSA